MRVFIIAAASLISISAYAEKDKGLNPEFYPDYTEAPAPNNDETFVPAEPTPEPEKTRCTHHDRCEDV